MATRHIKMEYRLNKNGDASYESEIEQELRSEMLKNLTSFDYTEYFPSFAYAYSEGLCWVETAPMSDIGYIAEEYVSHYQRFAECADKSAYLGESPVFTDPIIAKLMKLVLALKGDIPITHENLEIEYGLVAAARSAFNAFEVGFVDLLNRKDPRCIFTEEQAD